MASPLRKLTFDDVVFTVEAVEDDTPIQGNAQASDDPRADKAYECELLLRRAQGEVWAWALVRVIATWKYFRGSTVLGGCTYKDLQEFMGDVYYADMKIQALDDLQEKLQHTYDNLAELVVDESAALRRQIAEYEELLADDGK
jgi:hypothetical protein